MSYDVVICGGGIQGLWTAKYLAERKQKVLLLEQFPLLHTRGSSHGPSRITRYSYTTPHHAKMMLEAYERWAQLEEQENSTVFINCGLLSMATNSDLVNIASSLDAINKTYEYIPNDEMKHRFPGIDPGQLSGLYEKSAGVLQADKCREILQKAILSLGVELHECEKVESINPINSDNVTVRTNQGTYHAKAVVLTCGSWTNKVLKPLKLQLPLKPTKIEVFYWPAKDPKLFDGRKNFPTMILFLGKSHIYSTPILEYPGLMKVCNHFGTEINPDDPNHFDENLARENMEHLSDLLKKYYPNLVPVPAVKETCSYTNTPDHDFILDRHPLYSNVIIGAGFSGHGFKISPVVGRILGELALKQNPGYDISHFAIKRFDAKSKL